MATSYAQSTPHDISASGAAFGLSPSWVPASDFWSVSCSQPCSQNANISVEMAPTWPQNGRIRLILSQNLLTCTERKARSNTLRDSLPRPHQPQPHESSARQGKGLTDHGDFVISIAAAESVQGRSISGSGRWCCLTDSIFCAAHP